MPAFCDTLDTQKYRSSFKDAISSLNEVVRYGLPSTTDLWQPADAGFGLLVKTLTVKDHLEWLDYDANTDRWFGRGEQKVAKIVKFWIFEKNCSFRERNVILKKKYC